VTGPIAAGRLTAAAVRRTLAAMADPPRATLLRTFFKTGPGEYGAGDRFRGIPVPRLREVARRFGGLSTEGIRRLAASAMHEDRLVALLILVRRFERGDGPERGRLFALYRRLRRHIDNWDLVDLSAPNVVGAWLRERGDWRPLRKWASSTRLWDRRIAVVATHAWIRTGRVAPAFHIVRQLLRDPEDLIHKAAGWMLREAGKRDRAALERFLRRHAAGMPRTMLRYAIERFSPADRQAWLQFGRSAASRVRLRPRMSPAPGSRQIPGACRSSARRTGGRSA
jgi:3-methyladenine DNA glycosylase AlkD